MSWHILVSVLVRNTDWERRLLKNSHFPITKWSPKKIRLVGIVSHWGWMSAMICRWHKFGTNADQRGCSSYARALRISAGFWNWGHGLPSEGAIFQCVQREDIDHANHTEESYLMCWIWKSLTWSSRGGVHLLPYCSEKVTEPAGDNDIHGRREG